MSKKSKATVPTETGEVHETVKPEKGLILGLKDGTLNINEKLRERAFGANDDGFIKGLMMQLVGMTNEGGKVNESWLEFVGGAMVEINPRNGLEAMLAAQIAANHLLTMKMARMMITAGTTEQMLKLETMFTKTARTATAQVEALHKLRNGGKQKVTVEHVHVHEGGQAIVGNVSRGGGE